MMFRSSSTAATAAFAAATAGFVPTTASNLMSLSSSKTATPGRSHHSVNPGTSHTRLQAVECLLMMNISRSDLGLY